MTLVVAGGIMISFSAVFAKLSSTAPDTEAFWRTCCGGLSLALVALVRGDVRFPSLRLCPWLAAPAVSLALDLVCWHRSIELVGPGLATLLINFQVFVLAALGWLIHKERFGWRVAAAAPLALLGLWLLLGPGARQAAASAGMDQAAGLAWGLAAALFFGGYTFLVRVSQSRAGALPAVPNMAWISLFSALALAVFCLAEGRPLLAASLGDSVWLFLYGVISQGLGWLLISLGLPRVTASAAGMAILIMPTLSFVWDILFFGRPMGLLGLLGAVLALTAIWLGVRSKAS